MTDFLSYTENKIPSYQRSALASLMQRYLDFQENRDIDFDEIARTLKLDIDPKGLKPISSKINIDPDEIIYSENLTEIFGRIYTDIYSAYIAYQEIYKKLKDRNSVLHSNKQKIRESIYQLREQIYTLKTIQQEQISDAKYSTFRQIRNQNQFSNTKTVESGLILRPNNTEKHLQLGGYDTPKINKSFIDQPDQNTSSTFPDNYAFDKRQDTFWTYDLFTPASINTDYGDTEYDGALCRLIFIMPSIHMANEFKMLPFSKYPYKIIDFYLYDGAAKITPSNLCDSSGDFIPTDLITDWVTFRFSETPVYAIELIIQQRHHEEHVYYKNKNTVMTENIWSDIFRKTASADINKLNVMSEENMVSKASKDIMSKKGTDRYIENWKHQSNDKMFIDGRQFKSIAEDFDTEDENLERVTRQKYSIGIREVELNIASFPNIGTFNSAKYTNTSDIFEIEFNSNEEHIDTVIETISGIDSYQDTTVEYDLEIAEGVSFPLYPSNYSAISEFLVFRNDAGTWKANTRFEISTIGSIRANQTELDSSDYTTSGTNTIELSTDFQPDAIYIVKYTVVDSEKTLSLMDEIPAFTEMSEEFNGTDEDGRIVLSAFPFVIYEFTTGNNWNRVDPMQAAYIPEIPITVKDTITFGSGTTLTNGVHVSGDVTIDTGDIETKPYTFPEKGVVKIMSELIRYTGTTSNSLTGCTRGWNNTTPIDSIPDGTPVKLVSKPSYKPVEVIVNSRSAYNITDYNSPEQDAFVVSDQLRSSQFLHRGRELIFDRPISGRITVNYLSIAKYLQLKIKLFNASGRPTKTPLIKNYLMKLKTGRS